MIVSLQSYFRDHPEYRWSEDERKTQIRIQSDFAKDARDRNLDPMVVVQGGDISYASTGIGNNIAYGASVKNMYQMESCNQFTADSNVNIHCIASAPDAAEEMGFEVAMYFQSLRSNIGNILQLQNISMPRQSKPQQMGGEEWAGNFDSVVSFSYSFAIRRKHTPVDPGELLKAIEFYLEHEPTVPREGDKDKDGKPINTSEKGGTNTGGNNGNWGGTGLHDTSKLPSGSTTDGIDDGSITLTLNINKDTISEEQALPSPPKT